MMAWRRCCCLSLDVVEVEMGWMQEMGVKDGSLLDWLLCLGVLIIVLGGLVEGEII